MYKNLVKNGINYLSQLVSLPGFLKHQQYGDVSLFDSPFEDFILVGNTAFTGHFSGFSDLFLGFQVKKQLQKQLGGGHIGTMSGNRGWNGRKKVTLDTYLYKWMFP